jgi:hypothetical protein
LEDCIQSLGPYLDCLQLGLITDIAADYLSYTLSRALERYDMVILEGLAHPVQHSWLQEILKQSSWACQLMLVDCQQEVPPTDDSHGLPESHSGLCPITCYLAINGRLQEDVPYSRAVLSPAWEQCFHQLVDSGLGQFIGKLPKIETDPLTDETMSRLLSKALSRINWPWDIRHS